MNYVLATDGLACDGLSAPATIGIGAGELWVAITPKDETSGNLARLLLGLQAAESGVVHLFGQDLAALSERERLHLRRRVGLVASGGGLISNLKVLENLLLPVQYHQHALAAPPQEAALAALQRVGYREEPMRLPGLLSRYQRKQAALARALLMDPELLIYDSLEQGVTIAEREALFSLACAFHDERPGRASLFLSADPSLPSRLPRAAVINLCPGATA